MAYPLKLRYFPKTALWGGSTLKSLWNKPCDFDKLAETWELTVRPDATNLIENGEFAGDGLDKHVEDGKFPLLIKFIDAEDKLSVQVHPDDKFAAEVENDVGKTEMWYIADAKEGAEIIYGINEGVSELLCDKGIESQVKRVKVKKGDSFFIPSGMLHAIGKGCLIAEIQQNSDLTYRVYDYDRKDANGNTRELHTEKAKKVVRYFSDAQVDAIRFSNPDKIGVGECLASCVYFNVNRITLANSQCTLETKGFFHSLLCVEGEGKISCGDQDYYFKKGDSYYIPKEIENYEISGTATVLISTYN